MVKKVIDLLHREFSSINQAAIILGLFTLLSQILGLLRDRAFAHFIGPSSELDIYYASFKIPDFIFVSVASLASVTVLLPFLIEKLGVKQNGELNGGTDSSRKFFSDTFTVFLWFMIFSSVLVYIFMPKLVTLVAPGFNADEIKQLISISRIMVLSPILLGLSNLFGSVTQMYRKFLVFSLSPLFYNLGIILGIIFLYPLFGLKGLALGVVFGAFLHAVIQLPVLIRHNFLPSLSFNINWKDLKRLVNTSLPRTLGLSVHTLSLIAIVAIASKIGEGSISIFQFSLNLQNVPLGIIGASYSVAAFPTLAQFFAGSRIREFVEYITVAARQIIFWSLPIMFLFIVLRAQIVRVILGTGQFSWEDTRLTAASLALFSISIVAQSLILLFTRGYYAAGNTRKPLIINLVSSALIIVLSFVLVKLFLNDYTVRFFFESLLRIDNIKNTEIVMLPLAYSVGSILNAFLLWVFFKIDFKKDIKKERDGFLLNTTFQSFAGAFFMGYTAYWFLGVFDDVFNINTFWGILGQGFFAGVLGILAGYVILKGLKNPQIKEIEQTIKSKNFWKANVISEGKEEL